MPRRETCRMDERTQFIARVLAGEDEMMTLCRIRTSSATDGAPSQLWRSGLDPADHQKSFASRFIQKMECTLPSAS
jgi:hypothetical protein